MAPGAWLRELAATSRRRGFFYPLGRRHFASFLMGNRTLLVSFETVPAMRSLTERAQPLGWKLAEEAGWSHLCLGAEHDTWFRAPEIADFFDALDEEAFFDQFDTVLFHGAGPCGYAACAYSAASPAATVLAIQPQATLTPARAGWDDRFPQARRIDFTHRYGYAPEMLDAARHAFILYDPDEPLDAMHAALFSCPHVTELRLRHMGDALQGALLSMELLHPLLRAAAEGSLSLRSFARAYRMRRNHVPYLRRLMARLDEAGHMPRADIVAANAARRLDLPRFRARAGRSRPQDARLAARVAE
ncbi:phosphoadenosine phosphosulfate reductase [Pseudooceanicola sp. CBS1P-1]|uniref:Phosphoadenosine phosphosulfate reductase n=1 Tax=Pseudooceanicola albus TaxID=2692189 RepID=A0A6L7FY70_9RHOB|nr:phosphoadenosine phosphosulfate reductase [Pseudooceanicola endophyticus]MXN17024.1 phosphoadenosine phosphosulfate reductase [Pseudooceanicola albus]